MCDERWPIVDRVEELCGELLPEGYRLRLYAGTDSRFDIYSRDSKFWVAQFFLKPFEGCPCAVILSYSVWIDEKYRGKGLGTILLKIRTEAIKRAGFTLALATVRSDNPVERKMLYQAGWRRSTTFPSKYNGVYHIQLWTYHPEGKGVE